MTKNKELAGWLMQEHLAKKQFVPFAALNGLSSLGDAYDVQEAHVEEMQSTGLGPICGWKIGLTSRRMQEMCGIDQPVAGAVLRSRLLVPGATLSLSAFGRLGLEFEIAVLIGRALPPSNQPYSEAEVLAAVDGVAAGVELVDDRHADYAQLDVLSLIADNSWNAGVLLAEFVPLPPDLDERQGIVSLNDAEIGRGSGKDVLGGPMKVLHWLSNHLSQRGRGLKKGDIVMTGSILATQFPQSGAQYSFRVAGIGDLSLAVTE